MIEENCEENQQEENIEENLEKKASKQRGTYITSNQKHRLILFVEQHYNALFERSSISDNVFKEKLWKALAIQLNCLGPDKNESGWRRCFICYKSATRLKLKSIKAGRMSAEKLNSTDLRIVKMCRMDTNGIDLNLMLLEGDLNVATSSIDLSSLQHDQQNNASTTVCNIPFDLTLIKESTPMPMYVVEYTGATNSCNSVIVPDGQATGKISNDNLEQTRLNEVVLSVPIHMNESIDTCSSYKGTVQSESTNNATYSTQQQPLRIGDIVTGIVDGTVKGIPDGIVTTHNQHHKKDRSRATEIQKDTLVQLVNENYSALFGRISNKINADLLKAKLWHKIMLNLNSIGPKKTVQFWKRCLSSLKDITKKKLTVSRNLPNSKVHGNIKATATKISLREQKIIKMFGIDILDGCGQLNEIGYDSACKRKKKNTSPKPQPRSQNRSFQNDYMRQPNSLCTNSTVTSAMSPGTNVEKTSTNSLIAEPQTSAHDIHSTYMLKPNSTVTSAMLSEALLSVQKDHVVPVASSYSSNLPQEAENEVENLERDQINQTIMTSDNPSTTYQESIRATASKKGNKTKNATTSRIRTFRTIREALESTSNVIAESDSGNDREHDQRSGESDSGRPQRKSNLNESREAVGEQRNQSQEDESLIIRPIQKERPQRRGVEVHPKRFVRPRLSSTESEETDDEVSNRRRVRLSQPLGVMAEESLALQRKQNELLGELLKEIRKPK